MAPLSDYHRTNNVVHAILHNIMITRCSQNESDRISTVKDTRLRVNVKHAKLKHDVVNNDMYDGIRTVSRFHK